MKRRLLFLVVLFCCSVALLALQKPLFMLWYAREGFSVGEWLAVVWHGLTLDATVAGYIAAPAVVLTLCSLWLSLRDRTWRILLRIWLYAAALLTAAVVAGDLGLYGYWGFRIDGSVLLYLARPREAMASATTADVLSVATVFLLYGALMIGVYTLVTRIFSGARVRNRIVWTFAVLLLGGLDFLAIRGGVSVATANVSKVYFSDRMVLNHAATNPVFSLLSTVGGNEDYASYYPFFDEERLSAVFEPLRGDRAPDDGTESLLTTSRPNVVVVILESFGRSLFDERIDGRWVMPNLRRYRDQGVWFENFFANSYRTDRGEAAILSGYPAQTRMSIMKLPAKSRTLPSVARSLGREGYASTFVYGGDLNFTNQASYMYGTGWQRLVWQKEMRFDAPTSKWGYADDMVTAFFTDEVLALSERGKPFLAGLLTLSSHEPFEVPYDKFDDKVLNAMAFTDECVGRMIDRWRESPAWDNLLVVLVADHAYSYPYGIAYNVPLRHRIPMIWTGGAVRGPRTVETYASQIDFAATLLAQMGIGHGDFRFSKNVLSPATPPRRFAYYTFNDGFGVVDATGETVYDCTAGGTILENGPDSGRLDVGKAMLQATYRDIGER